MAHFGMAGSSSGSTGNNSDPLLVTYYVLFLFSSNIKSTYIKGLKL